MKNMMIFFLIPQKELLASHPPAVLWHINPKSNETN
jgi:hypothetical protein